jgi:sulfate permease, SulP family
MTGLVFGLGIFVMAKQVHKLLGLPEPSGSTLEILATDLSNLGEVEATTAVVGVGSIAVLLLFERYLRKLPAALIVLLVGIGLSSVLTLSAHGVAIVGEVPAGCRPSPLRTSRLTSFPVSWPAPPGSCS